MSPSSKNPPSAVVGLDIGTDSIKVAEAKFAKDGVTITSLGVARTPEGVIENEVIVDPDALGKAIKALLTECGIKTRKCVSSVAGQSRVVLRIIEVPKMTQQELAETMKWEIERYVPFSPNEVVKDFHPLDIPGADPDAQQMEVLLAVAQQELIDNHVQTLTAAGLQPMAIDVEPLAAGRVLIDAGSEAVKHEGVAVINIGANNADLSFFESGVLTYPSPPFGIAGVNFTREIAEALGQTLDQAELTKKEYAVVDLERMSQAAEEPEAAPEPNSFDTIVMPNSPFGGLPDAGAPAPPEPTVQPGSYTTTSDGPVFDVPDGLSGPTFDHHDDQPAKPSFDLGEPSPPAAEPAKPSFDLGGPSFDMGAAEPEPDSGSYNIGGSAPEAASHGPMFDLDDEEAPHAEEEPASPDFDLSDAKAAGADMGTAVVASAPVPAKPSGGSMGDTVFQAISGVLTDLATELRRAMDYYSTRYGKVPSAVFLCGGTAKMPNLDEFLTRELGVPVHVADPIKNLKVVVPAMSDQYLKEVSPLFSVSIGLAIRDMIG